MNKKQKALISLSTVFIILFIIWTVLVKFVDTAVKREEDLNEVFGALGKVGLLYAVGGVAVAEYTSRHPITGEYPLRIQK